MEDYSALARHFVINELVLKLEALSLEDRKEVLSRFCSHCADRQSQTGPICQCWNDE